MFALRRSSVLATSKRCTAARVPQQLARGLKSGAWIEGEISYDTCAAPLRRLTDSGLHTRTQSGSPSALTRHPLVLKSRRWLSADPPAAHRAGSWCMLA